MSASQNITSVFAIISESHLLGVALSKEAAIGKAFKYSRNEYEDDDNSDNEDEQKEISMLKYPMLVREIDVNTDGTLAEYEVHGEGMVYDLFKKVSPNFSEGTYKGIMAMRYKSSLRLLKEKTTGIIIEQKNTRTLVLGKDINGTMVLITDEQFTQGDIDFCLVNGLILPESTTIKSAGKA